MKITMAENTGNVLSNIIQSNNQPGVAENLEMAETVEASVESNSVELTSDDLCSEKDIPELPSEECAALDNISDKFCDALTTQEEAVREDVVAEETQTEECTLVATETETSPVQQNCQQPQVKKAPSAGESADKAKTDEVQATEEKTAKELKKEVKKAKKAGKDAEHMTKAIMQSLNGLESAEEKIGALCKKYAELLGEHKSLQREGKTQAKQLAQIQRERDHLQSENGRALLAKSKLESLCRELQRHNRTIKDESLQRAREEDEKRKEISNKFQQTINEITTQMQENHTRNIKLKEENIELASKLKNLVEQYERREEHIEKLFKHKDLESQLYDAKLQQSNLALTEEKERNKREKEILLTDSVDSKRKLEMLTKQEAQLKAQLAVYTEKFEEFQSTLTKSNEVFQTFKQEMDKMTKKIKKLEKETNMWRVRWENSNKSLMSMVEEKARHEKDMLDKQVKISRLEKLCRALQAERNALIGKARSTQGDVSTATPPSEIISDANTATQEPKCNGEVISESQLEEEAGSASDVAMATEPGQGGEAPSLVSESESVGTEGKNGLEGAGVENEVYANEREKGGEVVENGDGVKEDQAGEEDEDVGVSEEADRLEEGGERMYEERIDGEVEKEKIEEPPSSESIQLSKDAGLGEEPKIMEITEMVEV